MPEVLPKVLISQPAVGSSNWRRKKNGHHLRPSKKTAGAKLAALNLLKLGMYEIFKKERNNTKTHLFQVF